MRVNHTTSRGSIISFDVPDSYTEEQIQIAIQSAEKVANKLEELGSLPEIEKLKRDYLALKADYDSAKSKYDSVRSKLIFNKPLTKEEQNVVACLVPERIADGISDYAQSLR